MSPRGALVLPAIALLALFAGCRRTARDPGSQDAEAPAVEPSRALPALTQAERATLLKLARLSLERSVRGQPLTGLTDGLALTDRLRRAQGAFVTLNQDQQLRGCIGFLVPRGPLYEAVVENARSAALHDRRFSPVQPGELTDIEVEISALSLPRPVRGYRDIRIGTHGITLRKDGRIATFLPHVAPENGWDLSTTLDHLAGKAGLARDAWRQDGASFEVYTAEVWGEAHP
jgi:AmmeMemoRadiSam system protein A